MTTETYGEWEPDPHAPPVYAGKMDRSGSLTLRPQTGYRRRVYSLWTDSEGRRMGRWWWERRQA